MEVALVMILQIIQDKIETHGDLGIPHIRNLHTIKETSILLVVLTMFSMFLFFWWVFLMLTCIVFRAQVRTRR